MQKEVKLCSLFLEIIFYTMLHKITIQIFTAKEKLNLMQNS
jgi:hypothetical protein